MRHAWTVVALFVLLSGCESADHPSWRIDRPRVLGARIEIAADPERAWPRPGEPFDARWLVVDPEGPAAHAWALAACLPAPPDGHNARCASAPFWTQTGEGDEVVAALTMPDEDALGGADEVLLQGVVCTGAGVTFDPNADSCGEEARDATAVSLHVTVWRDGDANLQPGIEQIGLALDEEEWAEGGCADGAPGVAADGAVHTIAISVPRAAREPGEELRISHFVTDGTLERQFSAVAADDAADPAERAVEWTAPEPDDPAPTDGAVELVVVARDLRGGIGWTTRRLCLLP